MTAPAAIFFDVRAAFPSIATSFILLILARFFGAASSFFQVFAAIYSSCFTSLLLHGQPGRRFAIRSGIRQGCPASGSIFVLCFECFLRALRAEFRSDVWQYAFADDLGLLVAHLWQVLVPLFRLFCRWRRASALEVNPSKTKLVPLWMDCDLADAKRRVGASVAPWASLEVTAVADYLGLPFGPAARGARWAPALAKYTARTRLLAALQVGWGMAVTMYNMLANSVLSYPGQFEPPPPVAMGTGERNGL